jgi:prepilin-type N-terminal cleavage/methylation domain-containing protein
VIFSTKPSLLVTASRNESGMTLIELLASLSLLAILLAVLSQFLYTGTRMWGKSDRACERRHQLRFISQTLNTDLGLLVNSPFLAEPAINGDEYGFTFWAVTNDGLVQVKYHFDSQEQKVFRSAGFWGSKPPENQMFDQVKEWKVEYYRPKTKNWELQWQPTLKSDIPSLIRVTVTVGNNSLGSLVFPIKAWHNESSADAAADDADGDTDGT